MIYGSVEVSQKLYFVQVSPFLRYHYTKKRNKKSPNDPGGQIKDYTKTHPKRQTNEKTTLLKRN